MFPTNNASNKTPSHGSIRNMIYIPSSKSLWDSTDYNQGKKGMVEYCVKSKKIINKCKYPKNIQPCHHCVCLLKGIIYIIDGYNNAEIISFNPTTKKFKKEKSIPFIGTSPCCVVLHDVIHIFNGHSNKKHIIYSPHNKKIKIYRDNITRNNMSYVQVIKYKNQLIRLGGYDSDNDSNINWFIRSGPIKPKQYTDIKWKYSEKQRLIFNMYGFGCIVWRHWLFMFGGDIGSGKYIHDIFALNLEDDNAEWTKLNMKCAEKRIFRSVLIDKTFEDNLLVFGYLRRLKMNMLSLDLKDLICYFYPPTSDIHLRAIGGTCNHYSISLAKVLKAGKV